MDKLSDIKSGTSVTVIKITSGRNMLGHLSSLGITISANISVVKNNKVGPMLVKVNESVLSFGRGICNKIFVEVKIDHS
jgi:Fe2+ transport system protein FeoA